MKNIIVLLCIVLLITIVALPLISSFMQDFYKSQLEDTDKDAEKILNKKNLWAKLGEPSLILYIFLFWILLCAVIVLIHWIKK